MTLNFCSDCGTLMAIKATRRLRSGSITRRYKCSKCGHRLTVPNDGEDHPYRQFRGRHIPSCTRCVHWNGSCSLGVPDQPAIGPKFAKECAAWAEVGK